MKITKSVAKAISEWQSGDFESAMLHACNAVDGSAKLAYKNITFNKERFTKFLRDNYAVLGSMAMPGIDLEKALFAVDFKENIHQIKEVDFAELIYKIHRCSHGHGDELLKGFELIPNAAGPRGYTELEINFADGVVKLSDRIIFGLLAVVVFSPVNAHQKSDYGYYLSYGDGPELWINKWWGRASDFLEIVENSPSPIVEILESGSGNVPSRASDVLHYKKYGKPPLDK